MPRCVIETTEVSYRRYDEVDAAFAYEEGEGDRSLAYGAPRIAAISRGSASSAKT